MLIRNVSREDLEKALIAVNAMYDNNIEWNNFQHEGPSRGGGNTYRVTLKVKNSRGPGARRGFPTDSKKGRRMINACYHVHGNWFAALFGINPNVTIRAGDKTITKDYGNWEDRNIGSVYRPYYFSEACDCDERGIS